MRNRGRRVQFRFIAMPVHCPAVTRKGTRQRAACPQSFFGRGTLPHRGRFTQKRAAFECNACARHRFRRADPDGIVAATGVRRRHRCCRSHRFQAAEVNRLVLRLRPGARPADGQPLPAATLAELQRHLGVRLAGNTVTAAGNHVVLLETPVNAAVAKQLVNALRLRGDVAWAEVERGAGARPSSGHGNCRGHAASPSVRRLIVTFADPQWCRRRAETPTRRTAQDATLSDMPPARRCMSCARRPAAHGS